MSMKKPAKKTPPKGEVADVDPRFLPVVTAFAKDRDVTSGKMMASFGLRVKGKIFAMVVRGRLVVKLPKNRVDEIVRDDQGSHFDPGHGRLMKEWATITDDGADWLELSREAYRFVKAGTK
jgi:TfoX/Sxy family transcriptional regulator of competence genes